MKASYRTLVHRSNSPCRHQFSECQPGFTIIETMLFLTISAALTIGILVGANTMINQQRYRDSVASLKNSIQQLYADTETPINDRTGSEFCKPNAEIITTGGAMQDRGTSDCLLLGRVFTVGADGKTTESHQVIGKRRVGIPSPNVGDSEVSDLLTNYDLTISPLNEYKSTINWGGAVVSAGTGAVQSATIMVVRLPVSGALVTLARNSVTSDLSSLSAVTTPILLCVSAGTGFVGEPLGVRVKAYAASQSAIEVPSESEGVCS